MKRIYNTYIMRSVTLLLVILLTGMMGYAKLSDRYNNDKPLVIVCDWDLPPYEFLDNRGNPAGYNIDILDKILKEMNLKHTFILKENPQIKELFIKKEADLYVAPSSWLSVNDCYMSENILNYYKVKIAMQKDGNLSFPASWSNFHKPDLSFSGYFSASKPGSLRTLSKTPVQMSSQSTTLLTLPETRYPWETGCGKGCFPM